jgi:hypothetical protein
MDVTRSPRLLTATWLGVAVLGLAACGGDDEPSGQGSGAPSTATSSATSTGTTATGSPGTTDPSGSPTESQPEVDPATGIELREQVSSLHAPEGWVAVEPLASYQSTAMGPGGAGSIDLIDDESLAPGTSLEQRYRSALATLPKGAKTSRLPDIMLGGDTPAYHLTYTTPGRTEVNDIIEAERDQRLVTINVTLSAKAVKQDPDLVASVLASFQWVGP